ncbi:uncharacterized protein LOC101887432 [Musca domestica]|uniref:Uncharacterized protein LOC101887432 n=2 Tax=Musca domestica TaxID=7370 RepID=A0A1I8MZU9_MUSDO|nr:uncharacterized protein LOC101887432 [Musca domestica]
MKIFFHIFMVLLALQLSWAAPRKLSSAETTTAAPAKSLTYQKRYELFDLILLKVNAIVSNEILAKTSIYPDVLKDYTVWFEQNQQKIPANKLQLYEDLKTNLQEYITTADSFKKAPTNCTLQSRVHSLFFTIENIRYDLRHKEVNQIWSLYQKNLKDVDEEAVKKDFLKNELPVIEKNVGDFIASLDAAGRKDNEDIIKWYDALQAKTTDEEKIDAFDDIQDLYEEEFERETKAGEVNCRLTVQLEWRERIIQGILVAIVSALKPEVEFSTA